MNTAKESKKTYVALLVIGMSILALISGLFVKGLLFGTFTLGTWISFVAFMLSLGSVKNHGSNVLAKIAFWASFGAMCATIVMGVEF